MRKRAPVLALILALVITAGCASSPPRAAYDALGVAAIAVDTGMKIYADRVVAGTVSQATQDAVRKDYGIYQTVMADAKIAVDAWFAAGATPTLYPTLQVSKALSAAATVQLEVK